MIPFEELTPEQLSEICNGCGGRGSWFVPPHATLFKPACDRHDYDYYVGTHWWQKLIADFRLWVRMGKIIASSPLEILRLSLYIDDKFIPDRLIRQIYYRWDDIYFIGVMIGGWKYFYNKGIKK